MFCYKTNAIEESKENNEDKLVRNILKSRNSDYLKTLTLKIKHKQQKNEEKQKREESCLRKMKENLGFTKIKSKLLEGKKEFTEDLTIKTKPKINKMRGQLCRAGLPTEVR